ncbi:uncharacterized protein CIMG_00531 [Coccidioides immitis RS]|uniref:Uncharacterized protein n=1 Tax=Coccidioides immitis (strain RS) TaxID=246410 RepID=J3KH75_COCIM|nr:uncharacterized protein CIMG_00531 [Coccidioides immitis RS]EAS35177.3 hypothetical protein CIMG_00531 [Coccidioides immitis RS]
MRWRGEREGEHGEQEGREASAPVGPAMPKKGATNQKNKRKQRRKERYKGNKPVVTKSSQDEPPLEAYCFIEDESGTAPDYPMAVYSFVTHWILLRYHLQVIWCQVTLQRFK